MVGPLNTAYFESIRFAKSIPLRNITVQINVTSHETTWCLEKGDTNEVNIVNTTADEKSFWEHTFVPWGLESDDLIGYTETIKVLSPSRYNTTTFQNLHWRDFQIKAQSVLFLVFNRKTNLDMFKEVISDKLN